MISAVNFKRPLLQCSAQLSSKLILLRYRRMSQTLARVVVYLLFCANKYSESDYERCVDNRLEFAADIVQMQGVIDFVDCSLS